MRILLIGGTSFVGRAIAIEAIRRGHEVTTFNRGKTGPDVFGVEAIRGDRSYDEGLAALYGHSFDAAIDPGGLVPMHVLRTARWLAPTVGFYAYVSSVSACPDWKSVAATEESPIYDCDPDEDGNVADLNRYGPRKAGCERAVGLAYPADRTLIVRPGTIIGPDDNVGQALWWLSRIGRGGAVIAPGDPHRRIQLLDVRDLAAFILDRVEHWESGLFNAVPDGPNTTMGEWLQGAAAVTGSGAELTWVCDEDLLAHDVLPWWELPLWLPDTQQNRAAWAISGTAAAIAGLTCRPIHETTHDTWQWLLQGGRPRYMPGVVPVGMGARREQRILADVAKRHGA